MRSLALALFTAATAAAQAERVGPFVGTWSDDLETQWADQTHNPWSCLIGDLFSHRARLCTADGSIGIMMATSWHMGACSIEPRSKQWFVLDQTSNTRVEFPFGADRFGAWVAAMAPVGGGADRVVTVRFYDQAGAPLGAATEVLPEDCQYRWIGYAAPPGTPLGALELEPEGAADGWLSFDDFELALPGDDVTVGDSFCGPAQLNSSGQGAVIEATGSVLTDDHLLAISARQLPTNQFGTFLVSATQGFVQPPGSQGNLCLGGQIARYPTVLHSGATGSFWKRVLLKKLPFSPPHEVQPGETWRFQAWFRDQNPGPTSNFTDGVSVTFS